MALDTNIALGVKPIEQPNMLAQMGQMMQLRQMQQGYEQQNALRDAFSQGADITDPATFRRIAQQDPTLAYKLKGQHLEQQQKGVETGVKINEALGGGLEWLSKNPSLDNAKNLFSDLVNKGVLPPDKAQAMFAKLQAEPDKIGYYANLGYQSAITAQAKMQDATSRRNTDVSSGASYGQLALAQARDAREQQQQAEITALMRGGAPIPAPANVPIIGGGGRNGAAPTGGGVPNALPAVVGATPAAPTAPTAPAATNMLMPGAQTPAVPSNDPFVRIDAIDARIEKLRETGNPKAIPFIQELISQRTQLLASAKNQYGGALVDMAVPDPANPSRLITVKGRPNQYGVLEPVEMGGVPLSTNASAEGGTTISPTVARPAPSAPVWNEKMGVWMTAPTSENPKGTAVENPEIKNIVQTRAANATLKVAGYDAKTGTDEVSSLIKKSTSGLGENWANKIWSAVSGTGSEGAEAIAKLETRANEMTLALAPNGSLGAGFSNEDRTFMLGKLGDVANPNKPMNVRLAAWEDVMERTARNAGVPYTKQSYGGSSSNKPAAPSATLPKGFKLD